MDDRLFLQTAEWVNLLAVPGSPAGLIGRNNESKGGAPIPVALSRGGAFSVRVRADVVAVDVDDERPEVLEGLLRHVRNIRAEHLLFGSGRAGHHHLYVVCTSVVRAISAAQSIRDWVRATKADATVLHDAWLRPPGSPHRNGLPTSVIPVECSPGAIDRLRQQTIPVAAPRRAASRVSNDPQPALPPRALSPRAQRHLREGAQPGTYLSRSEAVYALLISMRHAGWSFHQVESALLDPRNHGGDPYRSMLRGEPGRSGTVRRRPQEWLDRQWRAVCERKAPHVAVIRGVEGTVRGEVANWLQGTEAAVRNVALRRFPSTMLVAGAVATAPKNDSGEIIATERQLAEAVCLDADTVRAALHLMMQIGRLERLEVGTITASASGVGTSTPTRWRLITVSGVADTPPEGCRGEMRATLPESYLTQDVDAAVGAASRLLLIRILERPRSLAECVAILGMQERSLLLKQRGRRRGGPLRQLLDLAIVHEHGGLYVARKSPTQKAVTLSGKVSFHGRSAVDRRRRMRVRHRADRAGAVERIAKIKVARIHQAVSEYYQARGRSWPLAKRIADAALSARGFRVTAAPSRVGRWETFDQHIGGPRHVFVGSGEVVLRVGDRVLTRRARQVGGRPVRCRRLPFAAAPSAVWMVEALVVDADALAEALRGVDDALRRCRERVPNQIDRELLGEQLALSSQQV